MLIFIQHSRIKVGYSHPKKTNKRKSPWDSNPRFQIDTQSTYQAILFTEVFWLKYVVRLFIMRGAVAYV